LRARLLADHRRKTRRVNGRPAFPHSLAAVAQAGVGWRGLAQAGALGRSRNKWCRLASAPVASALTDWKVPEEAA
jgi:hypothetical protein